MISRVEAVYARGARADRRWLVSVEVEELTSQGHSRQAILVANQTLTVAVALHAVSSLKVEQAERLQYAAERPYHFRANERVYSPGDGCDVIRCRSGA